MGSERSLHHPRDPETRIGRKLLAASLGGAALVLTGAWAAHHSKPAIRNVRNRLNVAEHDTLEQDADILKTLAESFGVDVQEEHLAYWRSMWGTARALDAIIDKTHPDSLSNEVGALLSGEAIPGLSKAEAEEFHSYVMSASQERHDTIMAGLDVSDITEKIRASSDPEEKRRLYWEEGEVLARKINDITEKIRTTPDVNELIRLRREEAGIYSRIMMLDNPQQDPSIKAFNSHLIRLCETAYLLDSLADLASDFNDGVTAVPPSPTSYRAVGMEALRDSYLTLSPLPLRTITKLGVMGLQKAGRTVLAVRTPH